MSFSHPNHLFSGVFIADIYYKREIAGTLIERFNRLIHAGEDRQPFWNE